MKDISSYELDLDLKDDFVYVAKFILFSMTWALSKSFYLSEVVSAYSYNKLEIISEKLDPRNIYKAKISNAAEKSAAVGSCNDEEDTIEGSEVSSSTGIKDSPESDQVLQGESLESEDQLSTESDSEEESSDIDWETRKAAYKTITDGLSVNDFDTLDEFMEYVEKSPPVEHKEGSIPRPANAGNP